ncbi:hypothetical protein HBI56_228170 [Parastagonospora nodorum]|uniref:Uncharacterized protein n=1 Tax=Phaeosphaeria nodorum (strain SN15 / ATCC MYA-4574 / FGSC 10173) TaxID=321614 RepID=A0A7U2IAL8_PHANO|nr:hypothetical protein HBH56_180830 [Parastagonospora nodorum]QRD06296.1 hypothetical protein JI435_423210 [Parastagonospora nodorum SN15]KAH3931995.1 hypothetical protein HBH54_088990 [Parastagonospora nodorum]KAH3947736.1 hypothetical protein HBH53_115910 [Parastagonospora nodorum]KAH3968899.1 hypothetical protein HBH52_174280 [Parastagonospora nodorum]
MLEKLYLDVCPLAHLSTRCRCSTTNTNGYPGSPANGQSKTTRPAINASTTSCILCFPCFANTLAVLSASPCQKAILVLL